MDEKIKIVVPEDRYGLYAIDILDPDMVHIFAPSTTSLLYERFHVSPFSIKFMRYFNL